VRVAIIGAGWIAAEHAATIGRLEVSTSWASATSTRIARASSRVLLTSHRLARVARARDARRRSSSAHRHTCTRRAAVEALDRGIHVYLEKPNRARLEDARRSSTRLRERRRGAVGYQWRAVEVLDALREALDGQELGLMIGIGTGPTKSRPWFLNRAEGGGNLLERASHASTSSGRSGARSSPCRHRPRSPLAQSEGAGRSRTRQRSCCGSRMARLVRRRSPGRATACPEVSLDVLGNRVVVPFSSSIPTSPARGLARSGNQAR